jgi:hypothetical protein
MYCAFVDFEKAFDNVWRVALWYKLLLNKINGKMYNFIVNMYNSIKSCIVYNDNKSDFFSSEVGVKNYFNILENKDIFTFCKFRTTNTKLPIQTGRWNNIARENRKCQICQENQIGYIKTFLEIYFIPVCFF